MSEFDLIARYFTRPVTRAALGVGDDCALLQPADGMQLAVSSDMLVEGRHFFPDVDPSRLGHKALAVNLSDLAACGAQPLAFTLALALPRADEAWLAAFSRGLFALADAHGCELVGGDTTQGPLNICITVFGEVPRGQALLRSGARAGDDIYVSGTLGDARLALEALRGRITLPPDWMAAARLRLEQPTPRVALGTALRGIASAAIDISDGLLGDLGHILQASGTGARIDTSVAIDLLGVCRTWGVESENRPQRGQFLPGLQAHSPAMGQKDGEKWTAAADLQPTIPKPDRLLAGDTDSERAAGLFSYEARLGCVLAGGDDYELAFTAPVSARPAVQAAALQAQTLVTRIGSIDSAPGLRLVDGAGQPVSGQFASFDHFA